MPVLPDFKTFEQFAADHDAVPVYRVLLCDGLTPVSAFKRIDTGSTACLFESVVGGERVGRHSFLAVDPSRSISATGNDVTVTEFGSAETETYHSANPLEEIRKRLQSVCVAQLPDMPPFTGGAVGYAGYDVIRYVENLPNAPPDDRNLPDMTFAFYDTMLVFDHINKTVTVVGLAWVNGDSAQEANSNSNNAAANNNAAYEKATARINAIVDKLNQPEPPGSTECRDVVRPSDDTIDYRSNFTRAEYESAVERCKEYIRAGDIFQVVPSQRLQMQISCDPFEIYRSLRVLNPSPFMFFLRTPECTLVGSSPEIMCRVVDGKMTVRPLAGTRKRGATQQEDERLEAELLADEKERAEHVMLVDLGRNDVGRVASFGSIELPDLRVVERYSHVMHISSTVTGQLRDEFDSFDALMASLPAGTVSGAPKVRAMEIIDEFEKHRRGPYARAVGYIDDSDNMDTCITLRTIVITGNTAYVQAGGGIVADSDPAAEYEETLNKARGLLHAIQMTHARLESK